MPSRLTWECIAAVVSAVVGTLFHFTYEWSGRSDAVAWFSAVDESVISHYSMLHVMWLVMTMCMLGMGEVWWSRALGLLIALAYISLVFYTYTWGATLSHSLLVDVLTFYGAIVLGCLSSYLISQRWPTPTRWKTIAGITILLVVNGLLILFAYWKPTTGEPFFSPASDEEHRRDVRACATCPM
jgi:Family of unknown function (DUF6512)